MGMLASSKGAKQPCTPILPASTRGGAWKEGPLEDLAVPSLLGGEIGAHGGGGCLSGTTDLSAEFNSATFQLRPHLWVPNIFKTALAD